VIQFWHVIMFFAPSLSSLIAGILTAIISTQAWW